MTTQAKHTQVPWRIEKENLQFRMLAKPKVVIGYVILDTYPSERIKEAWANATFIVKAVNSHEQFVNILERAEAILSNENLHGNLLDDIRRALKLAE